MNLAIEYLLRNKRSHNLFSAPCSLFLTTASGHKLVLTINKCYGEDQFVIVKHWKTWLSNKDERLPPFSDYKIVREDVFTSEHTILPKCTILPYFENPFPAGGKQYADHPQSTIQDKEYADYTNNFCNTQIHKTHKMNWLWSAFESIYVPDELKFRYNQEQSSEMELQREIVQFYSKPLWHTWQYWRKHMLDFKNPAATELIFRREYIKHEKASEPEKSIYLPSSSFALPTFWTMEQYAGSSSSVQYIV